MGACLLLPALLALQSAAKGGSAYGGQLVEPMAQAELLAVVLPAGLLASGPKSLCAAAHKLLGLKPSLR